MFESVAGLLAEHEDLTQQLSDPALHADAARAKKVNRRYAELNQIKSAYESWQAAGTTSPPPRNSRVRTRRSRTRSPGSRSSWRSVRSVSAGCSSRATPTTDAT